MDSNSKSGITKLISIMLIFIVPVIIFSLLPGYDPQFDYITNYSAPSPKDAWIAEQAKGSMDLLEETGMIWTKSDAPGRHGEDWDVVQYYADEFAKNYWSLPNLDAVTEYLCEQYENYPEKTLDAHVSTQLDAIFEFYGFNGLYRKISTASYPNPYEGGQQFGMQSYRSYVRFLNQYYEKDAKPNIYA